MKNRLIIIFTLLCGVLFRVNALDKAISEDLSVGGTQRNMLVYAPSNLPKNAPLLISMHGMNQDAPYQQGMANWEAIAKREKFVVVYPNGINKFWDIRNTSLPDNKDMQFLSAIIDAMAARYKIDTKRVYLSGFSMGGMMTYFCANYMDDKFAAFAPVSGYLMWGDPLCSSRPIPLIHTHGNVDDVVKYDNVMSTVGAWAAHNRCKSSSTTVTPWPTDKPDSKCSRTTWEAGDGGVEVVLNTLDAKGHFHSNDPAGVMTSEEIWAFVSKYSLPEKSKIYKDNFLMAIKDAKETLEAAKDVTRNEALTARIALKEAVAAAEALTTVNADAYPAETEKLKNITAALSQWIGVPETADPNFHIYLCFGQSNMEGNARAEAQDYENVPERFKVMAAVNYSNPKRETGKWYTAVPPICRQGTGLTPADYFGRTMCENLPENVKVGVVHVAIGGTSIKGFMEDSCEVYIAGEADWFKNIMANYDNNPFRRLVEVAKKAQMHGVIKGILMHQGETDNGNPQWPVMVKTVYERILNELNLSPEDVPLLVGEMLREENGGACWGQNSNIATLPNIIPNAHVISSEGCPGNGIDKFHFSAEGYRILGKRYAETMLNILGVKKPLAASAKTEKTWTDVDYVGDGIEGHKMDIHVPDDGKDSHKVIVLIYGSAWFSNNAKAIAFQSYGKQLLDGGFAVVSINHRASTEAKFPSQINDVKAAIRFVRGNAAKYGFDTSFVGITGFSSGGHLSSLAGTTNGVKTKKFGKVEVDIEGSLGDYTKESSKVDAVVDFFGPIDMSRMERCETYKDDNSPEAVLLGCSPSKNPDLTKSLSPMSYIDKKDPKVLVIHGDADSVAPYCQSEFFAKALKDKGVLEDFITVPGGNHGPVTFNDNTFQRMVNFFQKEAGMPETKLP